MKVDTLLPEVYYRESRDFAYIGRLLEVVFNYMKTGADCAGVNIDNENINSILVDLFVDTLGFEAKHSYVNKDLVAIASAFNTLLKFKGTFYAIELAIRLLLNGQQIKNKLDVDLCELDETNFELQINIPDTLSDIVLLEDLFDYILPAGITYKFTRFSSMKGNEQSTVNVTSSVSSGTTTFRSRRDSELAVVATELPHSNSSQNDDTGIGSFYTGVVVSDLSDLEKSDNNQSET